MKTATVRDLRNHYAELMEWVCAGEDILITRRGRAIARLIPEQAQALSHVNWLKSDAISRDRSKSILLSKEESSRLLREAGGEW